MLNGARTAGLLLACVLLILRDFPAAAVVLLGAPPAPPPQRRSRLWLAADSAVAASLAAAARPLPPLDRSNWENSAERRVERRFETTGFGVSAIYCQRRVKLISAALPNTASSKVRLDTDRPCSPYSASFRSSGCVLCTARSDEALPEMGRMALGSERGRRRGRGRGGGRGPWSTRLP